MKSFNFANNITGWVVFLIATAVYMLTLEPSLSFWDCGEFIACAYKLQVGHPPGAPFYLLVGRIFTLFAPSTDQVAFCMNTLSALSSSFTILFLFWTISHIARKLLVSKDNEIDLAQRIAILGSATVGALAFTFSDSFWFSAVESEVYAMSSLFTAFVFWAILKWEDEADHPFSNRWIILIAYIIGLSIGVHLLNLLAIPAICLVYYFKKYKVSTKGILITLMLSVVILGFIMGFVIKGLLKVASWFELLFVNSFSLPLNSGLLFFVLLVIALVVWAVYHTYQRKQVLLNTIATAFMVILLGFSSYTMIIVRGSALPPMNNAEATNVFSLLSYLNREQYGSTPLLHGAYFNAKTAPVKYKGNRYAYEDGKYVVAFKEADIKYDQRYETIFPRMWSSNNPNHAVGYAQWSSVKADQQKPPTFGQNLEYFFGYQFWHMYVRYFMWNFSGRQNGLQGNGSLDKGNWLTGIPFIDSILVGGDQSKLPDIIKEDPSRNVYFLLPFLLGVVGMFAQLSFGQRGKESFIVTSLLFFFTGIAIILYLNQPPFQPRERDYAYVGSFYTFSIWIGLGVLGVWKFLMRFTPREISSILATSLCLISVPVLMASENWDDHNRSGRYLARDIGQNYLNSCNDENSVIFTYGDNDSFPLWYNQDVEGVRTDVRVCNLSYINSVWFIDQMRRQAYESSPMEFTTPRTQYREGSLEATIFVETTQTEELKNKGGAELKNMIRFVSENTRTDKESMRSRAYFPTNYFHFKVDKENVLKNKIVTSKDTARIEDYLIWNLENKHYLTKGELMTYDALATSNWNRSFYFASTIGISNMLGLEDYASQTGLAYKLVPVYFPPTKNGQGSKVSWGGTDTEIMYDNIMNRFKWGGINKKEVYLDETCQRTVATLSHELVQFFFKLWEEGEKEKARNIINKCVEEIPYDKTKYFMPYINILICEALSLSEEKEKATALANQIIKDNTELLVYFESMSKRDQSGYPVVESIRLRQEAERILGEMNEEKTLKDKSKEEIELDSLQ